MGIYMGIMLKYVFYDCKYVVSEYLGLMGFLNIDLAQVFLKSIFNSICNKIYAVGNQ